MPRKKSGQPHGYKSAAIRELLAEDPKLKMAEIITALAQKGITVSQNQVYFVKSKLGAKRRKAKRQAAVQTAQSAGAINPVELVRKVKELAASAGGLNKLKQLVDLLAE
jgi:hypothetical protein